MKITLRPLTRENFADLETVFNARGCSMARGCWCMYYRYTGAERPPAGMARKERARRDLLALAGKDVPPGLIGYRGKTPVGWISLGPRPDFRRLANSPTMKAVDDKPAWSIVCFVVPSEFRGEGVAGAMLQGAVAWAKRRGVTLLEAYPVDKADITRDDALWFGVKSMFDEAGFEEVARHKPARPIVRLFLKKGARA